MTLPDKLYLSGTLYFVMLQPLTIATISEVSAAAIDSSSFEYVSYCLAMTFLVMIPVSILNTLVIILRHYSTSDHPEVQLRFNFLFTAFKQRSLHSLLFVPIVMTGKVVICCSNQYTANLAISIAVRFVYLLSHTFS